MLGLAYDHGLADYPHTHETIRTNRAEPHWREFLRRAAATGGSMNNELARWRDAFMGRVASPWYVETLFDRLPDINRIEP